MPTKSVELFDETGERTETSSEGGGWEATQAETKAETNAVCVSDAGSFARHKWSGGDICVRCGATKPTPSSETRSSTGRTRRGRAGRLESLLSTAWLALGYGIEKQPFLLSDPVKQGERETIPPAVAAGRAMQLEAAVAGRKLDQAFSRHPAYRIVARFLDDQGGAFIDIAPLLAMPILVGLAAQNPERAERYKGMLVTMMIPVLMEQTRMMEEQAELLGKLEGATSETLEQAAEIVNNLLRFDVEDAGQATGI